MAFTTDSNIMLDVAPPGATQGTVYCIYVKVENGKLILYKDYAGQDGYGSDPQFEVPLNEHGALYFWIEDADYIFPQQPLESWKNAQSQTISQPSTVELMKMTPDCSGFSVKIDNTNHPPTQGDLSYSFSLKATPILVSSGLQALRIDPTVVEKGEEDDGTF